MSRYFSYLNSAKKIIQEYKGLQPFASFLKIFFSEHKKFGSGDRKQVAHICYCYFRTARAFQTLSIEDRLLAGYFLCNSSPGGLLEACKPEWTEKIHLSIYEKLTILDPTISPDHFFPGESLSETIDKDAFIGSLFTQPDLFLRLRKGHEDVVKKKLELSAIPIREISSSCISLPNSSKIDSVLELDKEAVVQDLSSQRVGEFLVQSGRSFSTAWDCCAGSGGKSILLNDLFPGTVLTVSDNRSSILQNLAKRFYAAGISWYKCIKANLSLPENKLKENFDLVLADVPCTGSGTWGRTPEQLFYFQDKKADEFVSLQQKIITNIHPRIKKGGMLLYVTCSVFEKENEGMISWILKETGLETIQMKLLKGYTEKADTLFATLLGKPL